MKVNFFIFLIVGTSLVFGGCARRGVTYGIAPVNSWVNPDRQRPMVSSDWVNPDTGVFYDGRQQVFDDLSEKAIDCRLPGDEKPTVVYSNKLCQQLIRMKKNKINKEALKKVSPQKPRYYSSFQNRNQRMVSAVENRKLACDSIKFKNRKIWCSECRDGLPDNIYCGMNGYYYPPRRRY